jgi:hypothetical protein
MNDDDDRCAGAGAGWLGVGEKLRGLGENYVRGLAFDRAEHPNTRLPQTSETQPGHIVLRKRGPKTENAPRSREQRKRDARVMVIGSKVK